MNQQNLLPRVIVLIGSGGVGKTSSSISIALVAARNGMSVGLLSIDPAKRLAAAMGIKQDRLQKKSTSRLTIEFQEYRCSYD